MSGSEALRQALDEAGLLGSEDLYRVVCVDDIAKVPAELLSQGPEGRPATVVVTATEPVPATRVWRLLELGAADVVTGPIAATTSQVVERMRRWREIDCTLAAPVVKTRMVGRSQALLAALRDLVELAIYGTGPVLLLGKTGTEVAPDRARPQPHGPAR